MERSIIGIKTTQPIKIPTSPTKEYLQQQLQSNCFDPFKSSPPNHFMQKLNQRFLYYENQNVADSKSQ